MQTTPVEKFHGKQSLERSSTRWEEIKLDLKGVGSTGADWIKLCNDLALYLISGAESLYFNTRELACLLANLKVWKRDRKCF
jgi:hypothetical protein